MITRQHTVEFDSEITDALALRDLLISERQWTIRAAAADHADDTSYYLAQAAKCREFISARLEGVTLTDDASR